MVEFVVLLLVASIIGSIAQSLAGYTHGGCMVSIAVGFIGAWLGNWLSSEIKLPEIFTLQLYGAKIPIIYSVVGAVLFMVLLRLLTPKKKRY